MRPLGPYGRKRSVERRQAPWLARAFARPVVIGSARGEEAMLLGNALPHRVLLRAMASGHYLDRLAAEALEVGEHLVAKRRLEIVAARVREHRDAAAHPDPANRLFETRPAMRHERGLALGEVLVEGRLRILHRATLHQVAREMRAAHHF